MGTITRTRQRIPIINIEGSSGIGKSTLLSQMEEEFIKRGYHVIRYRDTSLPHTLNEDLYYQKGIFTILGALNTWSTKIVILTDRLLSYIMTDMHKSNFIATLGRFTRNLITLVFDGDLEYATLMEQAVNNVVSIDHLVNRGEKVDTEKIVIDLIVEMNKLKRYEYEF